MVSKLVIVESPAKARTISRFLGDDYDVLASVGHIRDLPQPSKLPASMKGGPYAQFAVDIDAGFEPYYVISEGKNKTVRELKDALKNADELLLATDEDREGEAIAWHLLEVLKPKVPVKRMVFHEITQSAIEEALAHPRDLDTKLVDAQESRRILDRLVGYKISPLLWRKIASGTSAGRVQSAATRLLVDRERERMAFVAATYADVSATFDKNGEEFDAKLVAVGDIRIATGKDFNDKGELSKKNVMHLDGETATIIADYTAQAHGEVTSVETKPYKRHPGPPFTTSTLQQAAHSLGMSARDTMRTAQYLYENGYITYMRTDSVALSAQAISAARSQIAQIYGEEYVPEKPNFYANKSKGAQEAHEAIRPAGDTFRAPKDVRGELSDSQFRLYDLIWKRTLASQMTDTLGQTATVKVQVSDVPEVGTAEFSASGTVITFAGFRKVYGASAADEKSGGGKNAKETRLPALSSGDSLDVSAAQAETHSTTPPPRYNDASLVKKMEELGIGRPSTYAATIQTVLNREYAERRSGALVPTMMAFSVTRLLEEGLPELVDYDFTALMEADLDRIAAGDDDRVAYLTRFWKGEGKQAGLESKVDNLGDVDAREINSINLGGGLLLRNGRYGAYIQEVSEVGDEGRRASVPQGLALDEITAAKAREILETVADGDKELGIDPNSGHMIVAKEGRYGPYFTEIIPEDEVVLTKSGKPSKRQPKPRTASLFKTMNLDTVTLQDALRLFELPRVVGVTEDGYEIKAQNGRYGPYLTKEKEGDTAKPETRSLTSEDQIFEVTLEEAEALYAQPKGRRGRASSAAPLKEFGNDPATGAPVVMKDGRFGPYVTDGTTNASLRKGDEVESLTAERAYELLADRRAKGPAKKRTTKKTATKKTAAKKTAKK
ncbi:MAG: type I DNA topoisomerase [Actinomycetaceae bacterium]|nr:type I DNA topoisomerase [Actinomycetaceae bacterium]